MSPRILFGSLLVAQCVACGAEDTPRSERTSLLAASGADCPAPSRDATAAGSAAWLRASDALAISSIVTDAEGNLWVARQGSEVSKLDPEGNVIWSKPFGGLVALSDDGTAYVAGGHEMKKLDADGSELLTIDFGEGRSIESLVATENAVFISGLGLGTVKLDALGQRVWKRDFFGKLAVDAAGGVAVAGGLSEPTDFGGGVLASRGGSDVFVARLGADGEHLFSRVFGDAGPQQRAEAVAFDATGRVVVAGVFDGSLDFDSGAITLRADACSGDAWCNTFGFVASLDDSGVAAWGQSLGPMRSVSGVAADSQGNHVLSGTLPGGMRPFRNTWLAKLDAEGQQLWRRAEWPETGIGAGHAVAVDACDNVFWSVSARPDLESEERAYLAKLSP